MHETCCIMAIPSLPEANQAIKNTADQQIYVFFRPIKQKALFFCSKLSSRLRNHSKFLSKGADFEFLIVPDRTVQGISGDYA